MADLNKIYNGYVETLSSFIPFEVCHGVNGPFGVCIGSKETVNLVEKFPEQYKDFKDAIDQFNADSQSTVDGVKLEYTTDQNRTAWLADRIKAVDLRTNFIRDRTDMLKATIVANGGSVDNVVGDAILTIGAAVIPVIGAAAKKLIDSVKKADQAEILATTQAIYNRYVQDITDLAAIKKQLLTEYTAASNTGTGSGTGTGNTPAPAASAAVPTVYYWYGGAVLLVLLLLYMTKKRNRKR
ncbi:hypothetical protein [Spirosoma litoris]